MTARRQVGSTVMCKNYIFSYSLTQLASIEMVLKSKGCIVGQVSVVQGINGLFILIIVLYCMYVNILHYTCFELYCQLFFSLSL